ncbi:MAG TPA: GNAT family N-acetyltransferase [Solirubrobacteraceae bacterium]
MSSFDVAPITVAQTRGLRQSVLRPHQTLAELAAHEPTDAFALGAFDGTALVAVGFIAPDGEPGSWRIRGMATEAVARGRGAGTGILTGLIAHALEHGAQRIWCNARTPARSLYERAGMQIVSAEFELPEIGPHFVMELRPGTAASVTTA